MLLVLSMLVLTGCGNSGYEPKEALSSTLKLLQSKDFDDFAKVTGADKKQVEKEYNDMFKVFDSFGLSQDFYEKVLAKTYSKVKYEVKDTKEESDGKYTLTVEVSPLKFFSSDPDKLEKEISDYVTKEAARVQNGEVSYTPDEIAINLGEHVLTSAAAIVDEDPKYGDSKTVKVEVQKDKEGHVIMDEKNTNKFLESLIDFSDIDDMYKD